MTAIRRKLFKLLPNRFREPLDLEFLTGGAQPKDPKGSFIFLASSELFFYRSAKMYPREFLPAFSSELRRRGYRTVYVTSPRILEREIKSARHSVVINIYNEDNIISMDPVFDPILEKASCVFNSRKTGSLIASKDTTRQELGAAGVPFPDILTGDVADRKGFSNGLTGSGVEVFLFNPGDPLPDGRFNTEFVDTTVEYQGQTYFTMVRLMCIGPHITHLFVRAHVLASGPNVGGGKGVYDYALLDAFTDILARPHLDKFRSIARRCYSVLGPGFYSHDILVDHRSNSIFMCETGFKFDCGKAMYKLAELSEKLDFLDGFLLPSEIGCNSVEVFLEVVSEHLPTEQALEKDRTL